jgi:predicted Zn-ribbon and HTH transcriptional regulator
MTSAGESIEMRVGIVTKGQGNSKSRATGRKHLLNFTLRGLPELEHFPDQESRRKALEEIAGEAGNPKIASFWVAIVLLAGATVATRWLAGWLLSKVLWPPIVEEILHTAGMLAGFLIVLRWLHRSGAAGELRAKLLVSGVPVCLKCGYLLRGLPAGTGRCPECGSEFSPRVCELLAREPIKPESDTPVPL